jgi:hypothetical protein
MSDNGHVPVSWARPWTQLQIDRRSASYCRVTFDHPPVNMVTDTTVTELLELITLIEEDEDLNVVVFDSANPAFYLSAWPRALTAWAGVLRRLSRAPVVSIAAVRGRTRGAGTQFVLACDLRFASAASTPGQCRLIDDDRLDRQVDVTAERLARCDHDAIARRKASAVDRLAFLDA